MPIPECDPWREQYFADVDCPEGVTVPTDDAAAWLLFPERRWIYNKLLVCETQGIEAAPHGVEPPCYPVFSKPIYNMRGMGIGSHKVRDVAEMHATQAPGHMWMRLLEGEHLSSDVAIVAGEARWWRHTRGVYAANGLFDYWAVLAAPRAALEDFMGGWIRTHLAGYTGMANFETIGGRIIEAHLRFADQWPDLYGGSPWVAAVVGLYAHGRWTYDDSARRDGFSVVLWSAHGRRHRTPDDAMIERVRAMPSVSSVQVTFDASKPDAEHAMPPGGFRLGIVNCWNLDDGRRALAALRAMVLEEGMATKNTK